MSKKEVVNRKELVRRVASALREKDIRKEVSVPKHTFYISDENGTSKAFHIKESKRDALFVVDDVEVILQTTLDVIESLIKNGGELSIAGFGVLGLKYRKPRSTKHVGNGKPIEIPGQYVPHFKFGARLKKCANIYYSALEERGLTIPLPTDWVEGEK